MNKRGQVYILFALVIALVVFVLTNKSNIINITPSDSEFKEISENYETESSNLVSSLIKFNKLDEEISEQFATFSILFTQYSKSKNPSFGLVYFLNHNNVLRVGNFLDKNIKVTGGSSDINLEGCYSLVPVFINYNTFQINNYIDYETYRRNSITSPCVNEITPAPDQIILKIGDEEIEYEVNIIPQQPRVVVISRENLFQDRKVFLDDQFVKGKRHRDNRDDD